MSATRRSIAVAVVERDGFFLIGRRPDDVELGGLWEFPGGKIEAGEDASQAALRECLEETGIRAEVVGSHGSVVHDYDGFTVEIHFVACRPIDGDRQVRTAGGSSAVEGRGTSAGELPAAPAEPFRWVAARELIDYEFPAANAELIQKLYRRNT